MDDYRQIKKDNELVSAAFYGDLERVETAIRLGANVNVKLDTGVALTIALLERMDTGTNDEKFRSAYILNQMTQNLRWKVNQTTAVSPNRRTYVSVMEYAMIRKRYPWVEFFLNEGANPNVAMDSPYFSETSDQIKQIIERYSRARENMGTPRRTPGKSRTHLNFSNLRL